MRQLFVWVRGIDGTCRLAGELVITDPNPNGKFTAEFAYSRDWDRREAFPLDPISLPLGAPARRFQAEQLHPPLSVFDDALPDDWGRRLLIAALRREGRQTSPAEMLLRLHGGGTGALVFTEHATAPEVTGSLPSNALSALVTAAEKFEAGTLPAEHEFRRLLEGSSRVGGARPKALVHDADGEWVAKFPSRTRDGSHDIVGLEATCLQLARNAGLTTPESHVKAVGRRRVLLVRRFDVSTRGGRIHMISMRTLCREQPGVFATTYTELEQVLRRSSARPAEDIAALYRQMAFNAAIGNVDDHLKNFWMIVSDEGYRLAPAFDLVPDVNGRGEHTLMFRYDFGCPTQDDLLAIGRAWGVANTAEILSDVRAAVSKFATVAASMGIKNSSSFKTVHKDIQRRLKLLA